jgi:hypothetical protein
MGIDLFTNKYGYNSTAGQISLGSIEGIIQAEAGKITGRCANMAYPTPYTHTTPPISYKRWCYGTGNTRDNW